MVRINEQVSLGKYVDPCSAQDLQNLEWEVKLIYLLGQVQLNTDNKDTAIATLRRAHQTNQKFVRIN